MHFGLCCTLTAETVIPLQISIREKQSVCADIDGGPLTRRLITILQVIDLKFGAL